MQPVAVRILHPASSPASGLLEGELAAARWANAEHLVELFRAVGVADVRVEEGQPDDRSFGERLRGLIGDLPEGSGLVVLGSGSIPLAARRDAADLVAFARSGERRALANNRYSADVVAIGAASSLASVPDLPSDNGLPRWLEESAGYEVDDLRSRWRLAIDLDSPLDVRLTAGSTGSTRSNELEIDIRSVTERIARVRSIAADPRAELVLAGRTSSATLRWLESHTASRTRAIVEERGLRAGGVAQDRGSARPPRSVLGLLLDDRGPEALGSVLAELGDGAVVDSRVLLAHHLGPEEAAWPVAEDRYASDLLLADLIRDPWLRALTVSARDAAIPVLLGGHTLVGPGFRLLLGPRR